MISKEVKDYLRSVKRSYRGPHSRKQRFLNELSKSLAQFIQSNPDATLDDIKAAFGKPDDIRASFFDNYSDKIKKRNYKLSVMLTVILSLCFILLVMFLWSSLRKAYEQRNGYYIERHYEHEDYESEQLKPTSSTEPTPLTIIK